MGEMCVDNDWQTISRAENYRNVTVDASNKSKCLFLFLVAAIDVADAECASNFELLKLIAPSDFVS